MSVAEEDGVVKYTRADDYGESRAGSRKHQKHDDASGTGKRKRERCYGTQMSRIERVVLLAVCIALTLAGSRALAQGPNAKEPSNNKARGTEAEAQQTGYVRPDFHQRLRNYELSTFGAPQMATVVFGAAISQADSVPPDWGQGWGSYGERLASHFGSSLTEGTTNFALAEALRLDTKYYPCTCKGIWPRVRHALISSVTARSGEDGHRVFSVPAVASAYAGAFATQAWYPSRYNAMDSFRTGNYNFLDSVGMKIALEFLHPVMKKFHIP